MRTVLLTAALLVASLPAQGHGAAGTSGSANANTNANDAEQRLNELRREQTQNRSRLDRLVELKILMDLGGPVAPEVLASLLPAGSASGADDLERMLRSEEQRLTNERERFAALRAGATATAAALTEPGPAATTAHETSHSQPGTRPAESRTAAATRPAESQPRPPAASIGRATPSLRAVFTLLQGGHVEEARAVLQEFPASAVPPAVHAFLTASIAERSGDLGLAERTLIKAMGEETRAGRNKGPQFEAMKLALDHITWKNNRAAFNKLIANLDGSKKEK